MASLLRQIVAGPRARHDETGLDLCYVTDDIIAMSGPSQTYPQLAYRNPLDKLVAYLDKTHGDQWAIWEFRAEGTGYPDDAVYGRVRHYPWPDHHPPPFKLVPMILHSMSAWLEDKTSGDSRVVVVHCKAGKGRSGTMACAYLIAQRGWTVDDALARFTARRMRPQFGSGVSIASQVRWVGYVGRWAAAGKPAYPGGSGKHTTETTPPAPSEGDTEIVEIHVWGLRHGVKLSVEGYVEDGRKIRVCHTFRSSERFVVEGDAPGGGGLVDFVSDATGRSPSKTSDAQLIHGGDVDLSASSASTPSSDAEPGGRAVLFRPATPIRVPGRDVNIAIERRNKPASSLSSSFSSLRAVTKGLTMVTSVAHFWFNTFFEGGGPEQDGRADDSGVFAIGWDQLDGIKGGTTKGTRAAERIAVVWRAVAKTGANEEAAAETDLDQDQDQEGVHAADWKGDNKEDPDADRRLGLRREDPSSADVSRASSVQGVPADSGGGGGGGSNRASAMDILTGTKTSGPGGEALDSAV